MVIQDIVSDILSILNTLSLRAKVFLLGIIFLCLVVFIGFLFYRWRDRSDKLISQIKKSDGVSILLHENPDPDCMSSGLAIQQLAEVNDVESEILYPGKIQHSENRAFKAVLDLSLSKITTIDDLSYDTVILVDHYETRGIELLEEFVPNAIIDHHSGRNNIPEDIDYCHIEPDIGACSTLTTEYLFEQDYKFTSAFNTSIISAESLATALLCGIMTDTKNLTKTVTERDYRAAMELYKHANTKKLYKILNPKIDEESLQTKANAIQNKTVEGSFAVSNVDTVENPDSIPLAADELAQLEGVSAVIIYGISDGKIRLSGRAYADDRVHMGDCLNRLTEELELGSGGGHSNMGGAQIPGEEFTEKNMSAKELEEIMFDILNSRL